MEKVQAVIDLVIGYLPVALSVVGAFAIIASKTPNKSDDKIVQFILDLINFLGFNLGKAKNDTSSK